MKNIFSIVLVLSIFELVVAINLQTVSTADSELDACDNNTCQLTWTVLQNNRQGKAYCGCAGSVTEGQPFCSNDIENPKVTIQPDYCLTFDNTLNISYIGRCPYNSLLFHQYSGNVGLPKKGLELNDFMCNVRNFTTKQYFCGQQRREGLLCGNCEGDLGPAVMSYTHQCVECIWYGWLLYLTVCFIPATIMCLFIIVLRINVLSPASNAIIFLCHILYSYVCYKPCQFLYYSEINQVFSPTFMIFILTIYGFTNMDFFVYVVPPFCISNRMSTLTVIALDYTLALYPLLLSAVIYLLIEIHDRGCVLFVWLWRPFHTHLARFRQSWDVKGSIINAFATLYVLSFTKVISTSVKLMLTTFTVNICGKQSWTNLYYNASCGLFQPCHRPHAILAITVTIIFSILPSVFIFLNSCKLFHKYKCFKCHKCKLANEIAKIFHRSFKDGTENTIDCRWFAGIYLLIRIVIATSINYRTTQQIQVISAITGVLLVAVFQPHTRTTHNIIDSFLFCGLGITFVLLPAGNNNHQAQVLIFYMPLLIVGILIFVKIAYKTYKSKIMSACLGHLRKLGNINIQFRSPIGKNNSVINQEKERLVDQTKTEVLCTVVEIND